jgi:hypothetical protein
MAEAGMLANPGAGGSLDQFLAYYGIPVTPQVQGLINTYGPTGSNLFNVLVARNAPVNPTGCGWGYGPWICHIVGRGLFYYSSVSGNACGTNAPASTAAATSAKSAAGLANLGISSVSLASSVGGSASLGFAAAGSIAGTVLSTATLGLGLLIGPLMALIQHHGIAVQNEDNTICSVAGAATSVIPQIDNAVAAGTITAQQGIQAMTSLVTSLKTSLNSILHGCNAACCYQALLSMHLDFANTFYPAISPTTMSIQPANPGAFTPQVASAGTSNAQVDAANPPAGSAVLSGSGLTALANGTAGGTFSAVPVVPVNGTGTGPSVLATSAGTTSNTWIFLILAIAAAIGLFFLAKG